jgi:purine-binding chemotaxis protein CheW
VVKLTKKADIRLVTFLLKGERYAVDVKWVREIINIVEIAKMINAPQYVRGMINLRGASVPVISLRSRFGYCDVIDDETSCIAVMEFNGELTGFIFDEFSDVIRVQRSDIKPLLNAFSQPWIEGMLNMGQKLGVCLNLQHIAQE